ncbi:hypothetical protein NIES2101_42300 [Calothrix sp. HK-06]|nr:hypothetical protein NIES2101_42300 [Calothrix sp. HK-06]
MFRSITLWLIPVSVLLSSFVNFQMPATAQTLYPFNADYDIFATAKDLTPNLEQIFLSGSSTNAPYGLTKVDSLSYSQTNFNTGEYAFNTDPTAFDLQGLPSGYVTFSGSDGDKLFGAESGTGLIDFKTLTVKSTGTVNITGGEGKFKGSTGTFVSSQVQPLSLQIGVNLKGQAQTSGSFKTIPEPGTATALISLGAIGVISIMRRRLQQSV